MPLTELLAVFQQSLVWHGMNKLHIDLCLQLRKASPPPHPMCAFVSRCFPFVESPVVWDQGHTLLQNDLILTNYNCSNSTSKSDHILRYRGVRSSIYEYLEGHTSLHYRLEELNKQSGQLDSRTNFVVQGMLSRFSRPQAFPRPLSLKI